ncbi:MAG: DUF47 domain-containing protein [Oscillospiraceae bacterium]
MSNRNFLDRLFPPKYDFFNSLARQAQVNALGVSALTDWLSGGGNRNETMEQYRREANEIRLGLEKDLIAAFSTPIERGDLYLFSVDMDKVLEYVISTLLSMRDFGIEPDETIKAMIGQLKMGVDRFCDAVKSLRSAPEASEKLIPDMRSAHTAVEQLYRDGMAALFDHGDPMYALKLREVYHHIKDAAANLDYSVDMMHRIIVGLT